MPSPTTPAIRTKSGNPKGWPSAVNTDFKNVNEVIAGKNAYPKTWSIDAPSENSAVINGTFGPWSIKRADDATLSFHIPLTGGRVRTLGGEHDLLACKVVVAVTLSWADDGSGKNKTWQVRKPAPGASTSVKVVTMTKSDMSSVLESVVLQSLLQAWLNRNPTAFDNALEIVQALQTATPVDTAGWHTVAAVTFAHLNTAIVQQNASPTTWERTSADGSISVTGGTFGPWSLTTRGDGKNVAISIPVTGGKLKALAEKDIQPCTLTALIKLEYIPQPGAKMELNPKVTPTGKDAPAVIDGDPDPNTQFSSLELGAFKQVLTEWLNLNLDKFTTLFATVDLDAKFTQSGIDWMRPSMHGYAVSELKDDATLDNSVFGVLCLIDGDTDTSGLTDTVSPFVIPDGADAGFAISPKMFLKHMLMPAMPLMFKGIKDQPVDDNFKIDSGGTRIINRKDMTVLDFKLEDGKVISDAVVSAGNFTITITNDELLISVTGMAYSPSSGINVALNHTSSNAISLDTVHDVLEFNTLSQTGGGTVSVSKAYRIGEISMAVAAIALTLATAGGAVVVRAAKAGAAVAAAADTSAAIDAAFTVGEDAEEAAAATTKILRGVYQGTAVELRALGAMWKVITKIGAVALFSSTTAASIMAIVKAVDEGDYDSVPKISNLASDAIDKAVIFPAGTPSFKLTSAQLNGALQFGFTAITTKPLSPTGLRVLA